MKLTRTPIALAAIAGLLALASSATAQTNAPGMTHTNIHGNFHTNSPPPPGRRAGGGMSVDSQMNRLSEQLKLTDQEKPKVKAVLEEQNKQIQGLRDLAPEERRAKMRSIREETDGKMKAILSAEQYKQFEEMRAARGGRNRPEGNPGGKPGGAQ